MEKRPEFGVKNLRIMAQEIRPMLPGLVGHEAKIFDTDIAGLLARAETGSANETELIFRFFETLSQNEQTRIWADEYLLNRGFPEITSITGGLAAAIYGGRTFVDSYQDALGTIQIDDLVQLWRCPQCDHTIIQVEKGQTIGVCPIHNVPLERMGSKAEHDEQC